MLGYGLRFQSHKDMAIEMQRKKMKVPFSQAQKVDWLFQHAETLMMDIVRGQLSTMNKTVLANVYDAIVIREQLSMNELDKIEKTVRAKTNIRYFALRETQYRCEI